MIFSLSVYVTQKIESRATVVLAPVLTSVASTPTLSAPQFLVFDMKTGAAIVSQAPDDIVPIASVTKLFAAAVIVAKYNLQATTSVTVSDIGGEGRAGKLVYGQTYSYRDLIFPLLIESSNDAALVLERVTNRTLIDEMNVWASTSGAVNTKFDDASGISVANVSTASDLQILLRNAFATTTIYLI